MSSRAAIGFACTFVLACTLACRDEPKPSATGDRVELTTDVVPQVCGGTIEHIADEVARIEAELALAPNSEPVEIHVVDEEHIGEHCGSRKLCILQPPRRLYMTPALYEERVRFEVARDRLARTSIGTSKPLFFEGLAAALTWPSCQPSEELESLGRGWAWEPPSNYQLLGAHTRDYLGDEGRYIGGELVAWLLDTHGPESLLEFMATLNRNQSPDSLRLAYLNWTGRSIDTDLFAHWRPDDELPDPGRADCLAPAAPVGDAPSQISLDTKLDCDSPRVRNDFEDPSRVFVEYTIDVPEEHAGVWSLVDPLPEGVTLTRLHCECVSEAWSLFASPMAEREWQEDGSAWLDAERVRLRVYGPIGADLDITLQGPCDFTVQDCPAGQQCTADGTCLEQVDDPAQLGEPCWPALGYDEHPLPCAAGLLCMGTYEGDGVCMPACDSDNTCPDSLACLDGWACPDVCDPFAPTCPDGFSCIPNFETGLGGCVPNTANLPLLEPCSYLDYSCASGLACQQMELEGCHDAGAWFDFSGCCTPVCDPAAIDPECPPELPACVPVGEAGLGTCQPA